MQGDMFLEFQDILETFRLFLGGGGKKHPPLYSFLECLNVFRNMYQVYGFKNEGKLIQAQQLSYCMEKTNVLKMWKPVSSQL